MASTSVLSDATMAVAQSGVVHLLWSDHTANESMTRYATCSSQCLRAASWSVTTLLTDRFMSLTSLPGQSLAVDGSGGLHAVIGYGSDVAYLWCPAGCTSVSNWFMNEFVGWSPGSASIAVEGTKIAIVGNEFGDVTVKLCDGGCALVDNQNWRGGPSWSGVVSPVGVAFLNGRPAFAWRDSNHALSFHECTGSDCTQPGDWRGVVWTFADASPMDRGLALASSGGRLIMGSLIGARARVMSCGSNCGVPGSSWIGADVDTADDFALDHPPVPPTNCSGTQQPWANAHLGGWGLAVAVDAQGRLASVHNAFHLVGCGGNTGSERNRHLRFGRY